MQKKGCCRECKYADWDADGCTCMIYGRSVYNASDYTCDQYRPAKPLTNADLVRQMTDEELAEWLDHVAGCGVCVLDEGKYRYSGDHCAHEYECIQYIEKWLKQEVSEDAGTD
jgi:hypothetical protein